MARKLRWTDVHDIRGFELEERHPEKSTTVTCRFKAPNLQSLVLEIALFPRLEPGRSNEKIHGGDTGRLESKSATILMPHFGPKRDRTLMPGRVS